MFLQKRKNVNILSHWVYENCGLLVPFFYIERTIFCVSLEWNFIDFISQIKIFYVSTSADFLRLLQKNFMKLQRIETDDLLDFHNENKFKWRVKQMYRGLKKTLPSVQASKILPIFFLMCLFLTFEMNNYFFSSCCNSSCKLILLTYNKWQCFN